MQKCQKIDEKVEPYNYATWHIVLSWENIKIAMNFIIIIENVHFHM